MDIEKKKELINKKPTEEVLPEDSLDSLLERGVPLKHYIGFEISGKIHLGTGLICMQKVADLQKAGVDTNILLADWHSWINDKLQGDIEKIKKFAGKYFKEGLKASLKAVGGNPEEVNFVLGSDLYHNNDEYWRTVIDVSKNTTLNRARRSISIAGREKEDKVDFAKLIYPPMQVADIFNQGVNIAHGGTDQRKAHVIAREVGNKLEFSPLQHDGKQYKPIGLHTHLLLGLQKPPIWPIPDDMSAQKLWTKAKMSKSKPDTCVFIHDSAKDVERKIKNGFCPAKDVEFNPVLDWADHLIFRDKSSSLQIKRPKKYGGNIEVESQRELEELFAKGEIHPADLKENVAREINDVLKPIREKFQKPKYQKIIKQLEKMSSN